MEKKNMYVFVAIVILIITIGAVAYSLNDQEPETRMKMQVTVDSYVPIALATNEYHIYVGSQEIYRTPDNAFNTTRIHCDVPVYFDEEHTAQLRVVLVYTDGTTKQYSMFIELKNGMDRGYDIVNGLRLW